MDAARLEELGLVGVPAWPNHGKPHVLPNWWDPWPNPFAANVAAAGYGGIGIDLQHLFGLSYALGVAAFFIVLKLVATRYVLAPVARLAGIKKPKTVAKFSYQLWLLTFYTMSTVIGCITQKDGGWLAFPQTKDTMITLYDNFPTYPSPSLQFYITYETGFYISELIWLFIETKRSDFMEYLLHHLVTLVLIAMSYSGYDHRPGSYILLLHDASDIFLCVAKCCHYANFQNLVNVAFGLFVAGFVYMRLYCLPVLGYVMFYVSSTARKATVNYWVLVSLLYGVLQLLHVYWLVLIIKMVSRLLRGVKGDNRSESDRDEEDAAKTRPAKHVARRAAKKE